MRYIGSELGVVTIWTQDVIGHGWRSYIPIDLSFITYASGIFDCHIDGTQVIRVSQ